MDAEKALEWIRRAQDKIAMNPSPYEMPQSLIDARRFLNEARVLLDDKTELKN